MRTYAVCSEMYLKRRADLDVLAALQRVNLTDQETSDSWVFVHDAVHSPAYFDQGDHTGWGVALRSWKQEQKYQQFNDKNDKKHIFWFRVETPLLLNLDNVEIWG